MDSSRSEWVALPSGGWISKQLVLRLADGFVGEEDIRLLLQMMPEDVSYLIAEWRIADWSSIP